MNRRLSREEAVKLLYQMSINKYTLDEAIENYLEQYQEELPELDLEYIRKIINGVNENVSSLDKKIEMHLTGWKMSRISRVNLALLRCSTYEIINDVETPAAVFINEAVEIAKKYSEDRSVAFINGVLDKIAKSEGRI